MTENRIKEYREKAGLSQVELSRRTKVCSTNISSFERGRLAAGMRARKALARVLKTTEAELFPECQCKQGGGY